MLNFKKIKVSADKETIGEKLRFEREQKKLSLEEVTKIINIKKEYLLALENNNHQLLPGGIYEKNFLKKYSSFLGLNLKKLEENKKKTTDAEKKNIDVFAKKITATRELLVFPKIIKNIFIILFVLALFAYLGFYLSNILSLPKLIVYTPPDNLITTDNFINVTGEAKSQTQIMINGNLALKNNSGYFEEKVELKKGINEIIISAQNKYSQEKIIKKQILVK